jgi:hypothetical protein
LKWETVTEHNVGVIFPSEEARDLRIEGDYLPAILDRYHGGDNLYTHVRLRYCDAFKKPHWILACASQKFGTNSFDYCGTSTDKMEDKHDESECED